MVQFQFNPDPVAVYGPNGFRFRPYVGAGVPEWKIDKWSEKRLYQIRATPESEFNLHREARGVHSLFGLEKNIFQKLTTLFFQSHRNWK